AVGAPLLVGVVRTLEARLVGRRGASPLQSYRDLRKLWVKEAVISDTTSWVFRATPAILAATMLVAALIVPIVASRPPLSFAGDGRRGAGARVLRPLPVPRRVGGGDEALPVPHAAREPVLPVGRGDRDRRRAPRARRAGLCRQARDPDRRPRGAGDGGGEVAA